MRRRAPTPVEARFRKGVRARPPREQAFRTAFRGIHSLPARASLYAICEQRLLAMRLGHTIDPGYRDPQERRRARERRRAEATA